MTRKNTKETPVTRRELAAVLGVNPGTILKWVGDGLPVHQRGRPGKPSTFLVTEAKAWRDARAEAARSPGAAMDLARERAIKERWQGKLARQQFETREKLLIPAEDFKAVLLAEQAAIRTVILVSYTSHADQVFRAATVDGLAGVERELKALAYRILRELADPDREPKPAPEDGGETTMAA